MHVTIGNSLLPKLKPKDKPYDVRDDKLTGFILRVNISGKLIYMCEYGRGKRVTIGKAEVLTPAQARDLAKGILADAIKGIDPRAAKKKATHLNMRFFIENEYKPWVEVHRKTGDKTVARIKRCFYKSFADKSLTDITCVLIDQWRTHRLRAGISTETINRDVATFKAALSKAVEWGVIEVHPLAKLKLFKTDSSAKVRYLNDDEEIRLRKALDQHEEDFRAARARGNKWREERNYDLLPNPSVEQFVDYIKPMILLSLNTGLRQGELFNLEWKNVDLVKKLVTIAGHLAKSGKTRHVPLNAEAFDVLYKW